MEEKRARGDMIPTLMLMSGFGIRRKQSFRGQNRKLIKRRDGKDVRKYKVVDEWSKFREEGLVI